MAKQTAIEVHNLGKKYHIAQQFNPEQTLLSSIGQFVTTPFRRARKLMQGQQTGAAELDQEFWAMRGLNFSVNHGEVLGVIGRNGAGKSTLLKVLSRITEPSEGYARINGRIGSLLEVGTGFHNELTGRENIYLNGSILGMSNDEIKRKYDEIVDFSGVEKFIDTPVKHYSSGMKVRLAFSVAAHLEPEILVIDEVLAVGDLEFQKKCLGKMDQVAKEGRTILFVSHNMATIESLCNRVIWLSDGEILSDGNTEDIIQAYVNSTREAATQDLESRTDRNGNGVLRINKIRFFNAAHEEINALRTGQDLMIELEYHLHNQIPVQDVRISVNFFDTKGVFLFTCNNESSVGLFDSLNASQKMLCRIPRFPLLSGDYYINFYCMIGQEVADHVIGALNVQVVDGDFFGTGKLPPRHFKGVLVPHKWEVS